MDDKIYKLNEFAKLIKSNRQTVLKLIKEGKILAFRLSDTPGARYRIKGSEVERLISFELQKKFGDKTSE